MTVKEFKQEYPQYLNLEGNELWDKMQEVLLSSSNVLYADPDQEKVYHEAVKTEIGWISIEDSSTTRWLNKDGKLVRVGEPFIELPKTPTESYRMETIDFSKI